jgi:hypothetical protein
VAAEGHCAVVGDQRPLKGSFRFGIQCVALVQVVLDQRSELRALHRGDAAADRLSTVRFASTVKPLVFASRS